MSSKKKNLAKQFQQNKVNRVVKSEKRYNKEKRSKSDEAYIKGDYKSSVSLRSYGVKKSLANGEKVSGYGDDYIDTKGTTSRLDFPGSLTPLKTPRRLLG